MNSSTYTKDQLWASLNDLGEDKVRERLATHVYGKVGDKRALVEEWLRRKDQERVEAAQARKSASSLEANRIARSAKNAAWIAAIVAIIAAICAVIAITVHVPK
jgi:hypothetical protein